MTTEVITLAITKARKLSEGGSADDVNNSYWLLIFYGPLARYAKLRAAHAPVMPGILERFSRHRLQRKPLVSDPGMHHGTCFTHVPWCMSGSPTRGGGENVPGIPGSDATRNFAYLVRGPLFQLNVVIVCDFFMISFGIANRDNIMLVITHTSILTQPRSNDLYTKWWKYIHCASLTEGWIYRVME